MSQEQKQITRRTGIIALVIGVMLTGGLIAAFVIGYAINRDRDPKDDVVETPPTGSPITGIRLETSSSDQPGDEEEAQLRIRLSKGQQQTGIEESVTVATGVPLSGDEVDEILERLPALTSAPGDVEEFNLPDSSLPPPRTGDVIDEPFPPPPVAVTPVAVAEGPLEVLRYAPEGEIPIAPFLNVTFNQPMVPLTTIEDLALEDVPVNLIPELPGIWKWLGTKTLSFEYESDQIDRFPKATQYRVEIPAGTESAVGGILEETVTWSFTTPPPTVVDHYPSDGPHPLEPVLFIAFDQLIDSDSVLGTIDVEVDGQPQSLRLASDSEIEADEAVNRRVGYARDGYWLAFRSTQPFPTDASVRVTIGPGTPSSEGPLVTEEEQSFSFYTYAPLKIDEHRCGWYDGECPPLTPFYIYFNNPLDTGTFEESMLRVSPELPGATVNVAGHSITIEGVTNGRTDYFVTVDGSIRDIFGQSMGDDETVRFRVGSAPPALAGPDKILVTLDPSSDKQAFTVYSINYDELRVRAFAVEPSDWPEYKEFLREYYRTEDPPEPPGLEIYDETIDLEIKPDVLTETAIDLEDILDSDLGHALIIVEPPRGRGSKDIGRYQDVIAWVQSTKIGLDAFTDHSEMVVWATSLEDGAPLYGVDIEPEPGNASFQTGENGLARFNLPDTGVSLLVARKDGDMAILPSSTFYWGDDVWSSRPVLDDLRWYIFDDRQMYRPGEEVHVKGWMRRVGGKQGGDVELLGGDASSVNYRVIGPQGNELVDGQSSVNALGGFDFTFTLPENANLGYAYIVLSAEGNLIGLYNRETQHQFQIQEFRRPEFEVTARNESVGPYFVGDHAVVAVEAKYFAGGPLPNAETTWYVTSSPSNYSPPNWPDFIFGKWRPWWFFYEEAYRGESFDSFEDESTKTFDGFTDASGTHYLRLDFEEANDPSPFSIVAEATVMDVNRQAWSDATTMLVHPGAYYVGLRSERTFVQQGIPLEIEAIVTDIDGNAIAGRVIDMTAGRLEWKFSDGRWDEVEVDVQNCALESGVEPIACSFDTSVGGSYRITATVTDTLGRSNKSQFQRWVSGGKRPPARDVEQETVTLIPDKETYRPGDVAQVLVQSPFSPAEGLLTVSGNGILYTERFEIAEDSFTLEIPIDEDHVPNLNLQVDLVGAAPRMSDDGEEISELPRRPAYALGTLNLDVSAFSRSLSLQIDPEDTALEPGGKTVVNVAVKDANGRPVPNAELAVVVVDEAILALTNYQLADPLHVFYIHRPSLVNSQYGRASIVLANPKLLAEQVEGGADDSIQATRTLGDVVFESAVEEAEMALAPSAASAAEPASKQPEAILVRSDFNPLATFAPEVRTDANGQAQVEVQVPDNLTRYRIMVVAVAGDKQFGSAESNLVARLPLMVRPSAPRFLNFGDQFELPIVLQNQTDEEMEVDVAVQASNIELIGSPGMRVSVPANDRVEVRFPSSTVSPGTARFQIAAVSGDYADAAEVNLPVYTPATTEAFATYGVIDEGAILQPVAAPSDVYPQFGGLEINTSSTSLQALTDAVLYLVSYRYECSEQLASRILAIAALRDVLDAFSAEGLPPPEELEKAVERDIETLQGLQNYDGGFPVWRRGKDSIPYHTIHIAHALQMAEIKGFDVPSDMQEGVLDYLTYIEDYYPSWYGQRTRWSMSAYALYVRMLMNDRDTTKAAALYDEAGLDGLSLEGAAWIWRVLNDDPAYTSEVAEIMRHLENRAVETAGAANFTTSYGEEAYLLLHSDRRTDAVILDALIAGDPDSDLIPKVVNGLLAHRTKGRWSNTQENVFVLLALDRYFNTYESETPDFIARMWLGETFAGEHEFIGRTTDRVQTNIPMAYLVDDSGDGSETYDLILSKDGVGRLYYRLGMSYSPTDLELDPVDMGFVVSRSYEAMDDPEDVYQDEEGVWHIKAGARVKVRLSMVADNRRYHVALVDPLPAGLEIVNPALAVSGETPQDPGESLSNYGWWWWGPWYEHQNMRDERAEAFTTFLWDGVYNYSYIARATTPGEFVVPPTKAEEMYSPEVFGRSASDFVIVE
ncbi:MAG: alpha-2-macroglobulin family protein [Candidatus Promineifilaceae bacterium]